MYSLPWSHLLFYNVKFDTPPTEWQGLYASPSSLGGPWHITRFHHVFRFPRGIPHQVVREPGSVHTEKTTLRGHMQVFWPLAHLRSLPQPGRCQTWGVGETWHVIPAPTHAPSPLRPRTSWNCDKPSRCAQTEWPTESMSKLKWLLHTLRFVRGQELLRYHP